jgi:hypothetical protein
MKAIVYSEFSPPEVLRLQEVAKPAPGDKELLIRNQAPPSITATWRRLISKQFPGTNRLRYAQRCACADAGFGGCADVSNGQHGRTPQFLNHPGLTAIYPHRTSPKPELPGAGNGRHLSGSHCSRCKYWRHSASLSERVTRDCANTSKSSMGSTYRRTNPLPVVTAR